MNIYQSCQQPDAHWSLKILHRKYILKKHRKNCECCPDHSLNVMLQVSQFVIKVIVVICEIEMYFQNCRIWQKFWKVGQKLMDGLSILHGEFLCRNALPAVFSYLWFTWFEYVRNKKLRAYPLLNKHVFYLLLTCFFFKLRTVALIRFGDHRGCYNLVTRYCCYAGKYTNF